MIDVVGDKVISHRRLTKALWESRLQALVVAATYGILAVGQGRELSLSLQSSSQSISVFAVFAAALFAFQIWIWTYVTILSANSAPLSAEEATSDLTEDQQLRRLAAIFSVTYSVLILVFVVVELLRAGEATTALSLAFTNLLIFIYAVIRIRDRSRNLGSLRIFRSFFDKIKSYLPRRRRFDRLNTFSIALMVLSLAASLIAYIAWFALPDQYAFAFGSFGAAFGCLAILLPWLSVVFILFRGSGIPIVTILILLPFGAEFIYSFFGLQHELHAVRRVPAAVSAPRPTIDEAKLNWLNQQDKAPKKRPIVFVTAAGGGIRAAYWTAAVLGRLEDCVQDFHKSVFSISSVSGGSLGAAAYVTLMSDKTGARPSQKDCRSVAAGEKTGDGDHQIFLRQFLSQDYLAPVIRQMLLGDIGRSLIPWEINSTQADRGVALELAWERAWDRTCEKSESRIKCKREANMSAPFSSLIGSKEWLPQLFLNGTHEETGKRLMTSTVRFQGDELVDTTDFFELTNQEIRISTAVLNSARFPVVSPSGALLRWEKGESRPKRVGHVIDGGYFDNNGTLSSHEIAATVLGGSQSSGAGCTQSNLPPAIFIEILNDTSLTELDSGRKKTSGQTNLENNLSYLESVSMNTPLRQLLTAVRGLESSRGARAVHASKDLAKYAENCGASYFELRICPGVLPPPALGWMLSSDSRKAMDQLLIGGLDMAKYLQQKSQRSFFACYTDLQSSMSSIISRFN